MTNAWWSRCGYIDPCVLTFSRVVTNVELATEELNSPRSSYLSYTRHQVCFRLSLSLIMAEDTSLKVGMRLVDFTPPILRLPVDVLTEIVRLSCSYEPKRKHEHFSCDIGLWYRTCSALRSVALPALWRKVRLSSNNRAVKLVHLFTHSGGHSSPIALSIRFIFVRKVGNPVNHTPAAVPINLLMTIVQMCPGILRVDAPITTFKHVNIEEAFLQNIQSLTLSGIGKQTKLHAVSVLGRLTTLRHLWIDTKIEEDSLGTAPTFSLTELCWSTTSWGVLQWALQNSANSLRILGLDRSPNATILVDLLDRYGNNLQALRMHAHGSPTAQEMVHINLRERCPDLRELISDHTPLAEFLPTIPASLQHFAFNTQHKMALWHTDELERWILGHTNLRMMSVRLYGTVTQPDHDERETAERWERACETHGAKFVSMQDGVYWFKVRGAPSESTRSD